MNLTPQTTSHSPFVTLHDDTYPYHNDNKLYTIISIVSPSTQLSASRDRGLQPPATIPRRGRLSLFVFFDNAHYPRRSRVPGRAQGHCQRASKGAQGHSRHWCWYQHEFRHSCELSRLALQRLLPCAAERLDLRNYRRGS